MSPLIALIGGILALVLVISLMRRTPGAHSQEYRDHLGSAAWEQVRRRCFRWTHGRCCLFPWARASHAHHLHYRNLHHEWVVRDVVPLCATAHWLVHRNLLWHTRLRGLVAASLRTTTCLLAIACRPWLAIPCLLLALTGGWWVWHVLARFLPMH